ncbi:MAG: AMP-binding protein [Halovenus sp.]
MTDRLDAYHFYERSWDSYEALYEAFEWEIPETFNMADYVCDRWATDDERVAVYADGREATRETITFADLAEMTNRLANLLVEQGVEEGDRVGVNVPQKAVTAACHIAAWKIGAVSVPLSVLFGPDALRYRLAHAEATACIVDGTNVETFRQVADDLPLVDTVLTVDCDDVTGAEQPLRKEIANRSPRFDAARTAPADDALIIYTSGTTGDPKGVRHGHRFLLGHLPAFVMTFANLANRSDDVYWMTLEWAWVGLINLVFCPLFYGRPVVAYEHGSFDPAEAFAVIDRYNVTTFFTVPSALRMMMQVDTETVSKHDLASVRVVPTGGEEVTPNLIEWAAETFDGAVVHTAYGQTEANIIVGDCAALYEPRRGWMGRAIPGHRVAILDEESPTVLDPGEVGEISVAYEGDPVCFTDYWRDPEKTATKRDDGWHRMEDLGRRDADGYFSFISRTDDVILSAGYKIGPEEVEAALTAHDAVADAGVIGVAHETRGEVPKAFVVLAEDVDQSDDLRADLVEAVKDDLAKYAYPHEVEFVTDLPRSAIGKIRRTVLRDREGDE